MDRARSRPLAYILLALLTAIPLAFWAWARLAGTDVAVMLWVWMLGVLVPFAGLGLTVVALSLRSPTSIRRVLAALCVLGGAVGAALGALTLPLAWAESPLRHASSAAAFVFAVLSVGTLVVVTPRRRRRAR